MTWGRACKKVYTDRAQHSFELALLERGDVSAQDPIDWNAWMIECICPERHGVVIQRAEHSESGARKTLRKAACAAEEINRGRPIALLSKPGLLLAVRSTEALELAAATGRLAFAAHRLAMPCK